MKVDFAKNTKRIIIAKMANTAVKTVIPFFRKTIFMWVLGSEYLGLNGLFYSILGMLMLAEMGFGSAIICYLYKPVAEENHKLVCTYLKFYRMIYRCVGAFIFIVGLCVLPFLRHLIHGHVPADINLHVLYLMFLVNTSAGYFFFAYRGAIFAAYHRNDIPTYISTFITVIEFVAACLVLFLTHNYYHYVIVMISCTVLNNLLLMLASRIYFPHIVPHGTMPKEEVKRVIKDVKAIFMHKIGAVISNSFDNIAISAFLGLSHVGSYGNYSHIRSSVAGISSSICYSMLGGFGNKIYTESKEDNFKLLMKANRIVICVIIWCAAMLLALYQPFMINWTLKDPSLMQHFLTPFLMVVWFYEKQSRETLRTFKNAASLWQQDRWKAVIARFANLALNLTFIQVFPQGYKLDGVILATIITDVIIQMPWESHAVFTAFFTRHQAVLYWRKQLFYFVIALLVCTLTWCAAYAVKFDGILGLTLKGIAAAAASSIFLSAIFFDEMRFVMHKLLSKDKKEKI